MSEPSYSAEDSAKSSQSKSKATKRHRRRKHKTTANHPATSSAISDTTSSTASPVVPTIKSLSAEEIALLNQVRSRARATNGVSNSTAPQIQSHSVSIHELMGRDSNSSKGSNEDPIVKILNKLRLGGNHLTQKSVFDAAVAQMPPVPGFPSLLAAHRPDSGPSTVFRPELFKTTMEAYASASAQHGTDVFNMLGLFRGIPLLGGGLSGARPSLSHSSNGSGRSPQPELLPWFPQQRHTHYRPAFEPSISSHANLTGRHTISPTAPSQNGKGRSTFARNNLGGGFRAPAGSGMARSSVSMNQQGGFRSQGSNSQAWPSQSVANNQQASGNQKTRKPYFMPYSSFEAVERGLKNADLLEGILRVNQRNYEESYVDNPDGDDQLDILILGVHDRNRALHGDVVVVKIKDRKHWVVRENLYQVWKAGNLSSLIEKGFPISAFSEKKDKELTNEVFLTELSPSVIVGGITLSQGELNDPVLVNNKGKYSRRDMIKIGAQMELAIQNVRISEELHASVLSADIQSLVESLQIAKSGDELASNTSPLRKLNTIVNGAAKRTQNQGTHRRTSYRLLSEVVDDETNVPDACLQKTAEVVYIMHAKNCRTAMGQLKVMADGNRNWALFSPTDSRMPRMMIPSDQLPLGFFDRPQDYQKFLFVARMVEWQATAQFARGKLEKTLGLAGDVEAETEGLLYSNDVDTKEFSSSALSSLPITEAHEWHIEEKEFKYRRDLRNEIIFTIDPKTARDLDDALSIKPCENVDGKGLSGWEIGVHIADVTHFLVEESELDQWAKSRATSVYLVHKVIPMLPRILCEELCSLNAGVDRLCFSVVWKVSNEGQIFDEWFGRTIIRNCCKMAYEHAQDMIENSDKEFKKDELPEIFGGYEPNELKAKVLQLHQIACQLRSKRMANGALRLDQPKLAFSLDEETKMPNGVSIYEIKDSNKLVEEFMLLANMAVARKIESHFPKISLLRRHPAPKQKVLKEILELCDKIGFPIDASSSGTLASSIRRYEGDDEVKASIGQVLSMLLMKPMQLAVYFCTGSVRSKSDYHHYALSAPFYTHFTSPIRRYPDVMVHRLLSASLGYTPTPKMDKVEDVSKQALHCNDKKSAAKTVSDASADTFFGLFVKQCGPIEERGVVVNVLDASFDVLVFKYGVVKRVYVNRLEIAREPVFTEGPPPRLTLFWKVKGGTTVVEQPIQMCTVVDVVLSALPEPTKYQAVIKMRSKTESKTLAQLNAEDAKLLSVSKAEVVDE